MRRLEEGAWTDGQTERVRCTGLGVAGSLVPAPSPHPILHQPRATPPPHNLPACWPRPPCLPLAPQSPDGTAAGTGLHRPEGALLVSACPCPSSGLRPPLPHPHPGGRGPAQITYPLGGGGGLITLRPGSHRPTTCGSLCPPRHPLCTSEVHLPLPGASPLPSQSQPLHPHPLPHPPILAICRPGTRCARVGE